MLKHFQECDLGYTFKTDKVFGLFGNSRATLPEIEKAFPEFTFSKIKQTHSNLVVEASPELNEADAHWTTNKNNALLISTADCTPILVFDESSQKIAAIHAGWRGVENKIALKTVLSLVQDNAKPNLKIWIGPHILKNSFEVQADTLKLLLASAFNSESSVFFEKIESGFLVDLKSILLSQFSSLKLSQVDISSLDIDTKTNLNFHSYRRDKNLSGRNLSFIAKI